MLEWKDERREVPLQIRANKAFKQSLTKFFFNKINKTLFGGNNVIERQSLVQILVISFIKMGGGEVKGCLVSN